MYISKPGDRFSFTDGEDESTKVPLLFKELNEATDGGIQSGETAFVLADSGQGKSTFIDNSASANAIFFKTERPKHWVYLFLTEENTCERKRRILMSHYSKTSKELKAEKEIIFPDMNLIMFDYMDYNLTIDEMQTLVDSFSSSHEPGIIYLDYIGELHGVVGGDHSAYTLAAKQLKTWAQQLKLPIITGAQAVKGEGFNYNEGHLLNDANIGGAKALRNNASLFFSINRTDTQKKSLTATINLFKNRRGPCKDFEVYMDLSTFSIGSL